MKQANQALQKRPGWPAARALRAIVLLATGHRTEALESVEAIRKDIEDGRVPLDEDGLNKMQLFYTEARTENKTGGLYEQAWGMQPDSVGLAETAFGMYVRSSNYSSAQAVAVKLRRTFPARSSVYSLWTALASWLSMMPAAGYVAPRDERLLTLASMYVTKVLAEKIPTGEEIRFAKRLLVDAGKLDEASKLLQRPDLVISRVEVMRWLGHIAQCSGRLEDAATVYLALLSEFESDDWAHWVQYFKCVDAEGKGREDAWALVDSLRGRELNAKYARRGPYLARMELLLREKKWDELREAVVDYFDTFAKKTVCPHDVRPYVWYMVQECKEGDLFEQLLTNEKLDKGVPRINRSWLLLWFDRLEDSVETLTEQYHSLLDEHADPDVLQAGDDFALMAVHKLLPVVDGESRYSNPKNMFRAIALLEFALSLSPSNYNIKLLLVVLNTQLMTVDNAFAVWSQMSVKHIQLASLSHLVLRPLFMAANVDNLDRLHSMLMSLWRECDKDIPEGISRALRAHSLNAVVEFVVFRHRLGRSCVLAEGMNLEMLSKLGTPDFNVLEKDSIYTLQGVVPRFSGSQKEMDHGLVANADMTCLDFWNTEKYDPDLRLKDEHAADIEEGTLMRATELQMTYSHIKATHIIISFIKGCEPPAEALEAIADNWLLKQPGVVQNGNTSEPLSNCSSLIDSAVRGKFLMSFALNVNAIRQALLNKVDGSDSDVATEKVIKEGNYLSQFLLDDCEKMHSRFVKSWESPDSAALMPQVIEECGSWVCYVMILVTVSLQVVWPLRAQKKKQGRKGSKRSVMAGQTEKASVVEKMRSALQKYKESAITCAKKIEDILIKAGVHAEFRKAVCADVSEAAALLKFLPIEEMPSTGDPVVEPAGVLEREILSSDVSRQALAAHVLNIIGPSHDASVTRLLKRVQDMTQILSGLKA